MDSTNQKCPICYETIKNKNFIVTNCNHTFCSNCILRLNRSSNSCPLCRADLTNIPIAENINNPEESVIYSNQFYRRIIEESESSITSLEMSNETLRYVIQNLLSMIRTLGIEDRINEESDSSNEEEDTEDFLDDTQEVLDDYDSQEEVVQENNQMQQTDFDYYYNQFNIKRSEVMTDLILSPVWDYLDDDEKTRIYQKVSEDWEEAKLICIFPDIYRSDNQLRLKLSKMSDRVLKIIIKNFNGNSSECYNQNEYINEIIKIIPKHDLTINV